MQITGLDMRAKLSALGGITSRGYQRIYSLRRLFFGFNILFQFFDFPEQSIHYGIHIFQHHQAFPALQFVEELLIQLDILLPQILKMYFFIHQVKAHKKREVA
jgi:hypothetical protein